MAVIVVIPEYTIIGYTATVLYLDIIVNGYDNWAMGAYYLALAQTIVLDVGMLYCSIIRLYLRVP